MGRIERIETENFKSYGGKQVIGPFSNFTSIVGPNGAGKSNLMDAISFVLGVGARYLRGEVLKDLIHKPEGVVLDAAEADAADRDGDGDDVEGKEEKKMESDDDVVAEEEEEEGAEKGSSKGKGKPKGKGKGKGSKTTSRRRSRGGAGGGIRRASVKMVFVVDIEAEKLEMSVGDEITFERVISADGASSFRYQGQVVSLEGYKRHLVDINVLVTVRNFLVFQGDVESLVSKSPKELLRYFETISGSDQFRDDYESLQRESEESTEAFLLANNDKRNLVAERRELKREKDEAEQYQQRHAELAGLKRELSLWRLLHISEAMKEATEAVDEKKAARKEASGKLKAAEETQKALKRAEARLQRKKAEEEQTRTRALQDERISTKDFELAEKKVDASNRKLAQLQKSEESMKSKAEANQEEIRKLREEITDAEAQMREEEEEALEAGRKSGVVLTEAQEARTRELEALAVTRTAQLRSLLEDSKQQRATAELQLEPLRTQLQTSKRRVQELRDEMEVEVDQIAKRNKAVADCTAAISRASEELAAAQESVRVDFARQKEVVAELEEVEAVLKDAKEARSVSKKEDAARSAVSEMRRMMTGVHGRLCDLIDPTEHKWQVAVATALGRHMDSVVVDTAAVAHECIQHLRGMQNAPMTFLPLDSLTIKPVPDAVLAKMGGRLRMARDCVKFDPAYNRAVAYAFGSTVIADTYDDARRLCFRDKVAVKCVSLDGAVIAKNRLITGGSTSEGSKSRRFDGRKIEAARDRRQELKQEEETLRRKLGKLRAGSRVPCPQAILDLEARIKTDESMLTSVEADLADRQAKQKARTAECKKLEKDVSKLQANIKKVETEIVSIDARVEDLERQIRVVEDEVFADFSKEVGVASYRELQQKSEERKTILHKQTRKRAAHLSELRSHLERLESRDDEKRLAAFSPKLKAERKKLKKLEAEAAAAQEKLTAAKVEAKESSRRYEELDVQLREKSEERAAARRVVNDLAKQLESLKKSLTSKEAALERLQAKWKDTIVSDTELGVEPDCTPDDLDFDGLEHDPETEDEARVEAELKERIRDLTALLESSQPNLKAFEKFEEIDAKVREQENHCRKLQQQNRAKQIGFAEVKQARTKLFMDLFEFVSATIDSVYKDLTRSTLHPDGGSASMVLANGDDPFSDGLRYNAMPPTKRYSDISKLSGGEKTIASLALLFTIHKYIPAPFYIMDEIDAALDNTNIHKLCTYIQSRALAKENPLQCLVISLKDTFYGHAESIVGIYKERATNSSRTLTMDLSAFPDVPSHGSSGRGGAGGSVVQHAGGRAPVRALGDDMPSKRRAASRT